VSKPQLIDDQEHERVFERVAAIHVAKAAGMVCTRGPHPAPLIYYCHIRNVVAADNPAATDTPATQNFSHLPWQTALQ
jgi:hypothetical protein